MLDAHATTTDRVYPPLKLALAGRHQLENAAVAVAILERWSAVVSEVPTAAIVTGLTQCEWPARLEWLRLPSGAELLIDAAHNPAGAAALATYLEDNGLSPLPIVTSIMADKDVTGMVTQLGRVASSFIATTVPHQRARTAEALADTIREIVPRIPVVAEPSPDAAVVTATAGAPRAVAAGSIFLVGPLRARLLSAGARRAGSA